MIDYGLTWASWKGLSARGSVCEGKKEKEGSCASELDNTPRANHSAAHVSGYDYPPTVLDERRAGRRGQEEVEGDERESMALWYYWRRVCTVLTD